LCEMCYYENFGRNDFLSLFTFNLLIDNGTNDISNHIVLLDEDERCVFTHNKRSTCNCARKEKT